MTIEFWDSFLTEKSWNMLHALRREYAFILIGGWAVYLLTKQKKSKDIDIVVGIKELEKLKKEDLRKNEHLKKYEIKREEIDVDIYVAYYSKLAIPVEDINKFTMALEGFTIAIPELMLILKQAAFNNRKFSIKGEKDKIDILSLLLFANIDFKRYKFILETYKMEAYKEMLVNLIKDCRDYRAFNMTPRELKLKKLFMLGEMRKL